VSRVFVLGNAGVDLTLGLPYLVRPGETVVAATGSRAPGGKGLNQAVTAARAGAKVTFCAPVGEDTEATFVAAALAREPLDEIRLLPKPLPTDQSVVMVAEDGENSIVSLCDCADALTETEAAGFAASVEPGDWLLLQGNLTAEATLAAMRASRGSIILNAAPLRWPVAPLLTYCAVIVVNRGEATAVAGCTDPSEAAMRLCTAGCAAVVVTLGAEGCLCANAAGAAHLAAPVVRTVDTSGAGDVFCGVLVARLASGIGHRDAVAAAQSAAAQSVTRRGAFASIPRTEELR
jgi:ribokinase